MKNKNQIKGAFVIGSEKVAFPACLNDRSTAVLPLSSRNPQEKSAGVRAGVSECVCVSVCCMSVFHQNIIFR